MALDLLTTTAFEEDLRRIRKQGKDLDKLEAVVNLLQEEEPLPARCRPHRYAGMDGTLGLPRGTGLATALQADRETTGACSHGQPYRTVRMNECFTGSISTGRALYVLLVALMSMCATSGG